MASLQRVMQLIGHSYANLVYPALATKIIESEKAWGIGAVYDDEVHVDQWFPKSKCMIGGNSDVWVIVIPHWLLEKKGLEADDPYDDDTKEFSFETEIQGMRVALEAHGVFI